MASVVTVILGGMRWFDLEEPYFDEEVSRGEHQDIIPFVEAAWRDRRGWYLAAVLFVLALGALSWRFGIRSPLQVTGLLFDVVGAFILGIGLLRSEVGIERDAQAIPTGVVKERLRFYPGDTDEIVPTYERHPLSVSSEARDTVDAAAGVTLLIIGFTLQILAVVL